MRLSACLLARTRRRRVHDDRGAGNRDQAARRRARFPPCDGGDPRPRQPRQAPLPAPAGAPAHARRGRLARHGRAAARRRACRTRARAPADRLCPASSEACSSPASMSATRRPRSPSRASNLGASSEVAVRRPVPDDRHEGLRGLRPRDRRAAGPGAAAARCTSPARAARRAPPRPDRPARARHGSRSWPWSGTAIARPGSETPSGSGVGAGRLTQPRGPWRSTRLPGT